MGWSQTYCLGGVKPKVLQVHKYNCVSCWVNVFNVLFHVVHYCSSQRLGLRLIVGSDLDPNWLHPWNFVPTAYLFWETISSPPKFLLASGQAQVKSLGMKRNCCPKHSWFHVPHPFPFSDLPSLTGSLFDFSSNHCFSEEAKKRRFQVSPA